jgi:chemotaxis protein MotB
MFDDAAAVKPEIVIIRRRGGGDDAPHKGGAWKIAYADFVTAMMAFFLVMWLINAANEATRAQVASYFNPIKLTDTSTGGKGLNDPKDSKKKDAQPGGGTESAATAEEKAAEEKLLADPGKALDEIATHGAPLEVPVPAPQPEAAKTISDPFDPMSWQSAPEPMAKRAEQIVPQAPTLPAIVPELAKTADAADEEKKAPDKMANPESGEAKENMDPADTSAAKGAAHASEPSTAKMPDQPAPVADVAKLEKALEVRQEILKALHLQSDQLPANIDIKGTAEGLLISLTDKNDFGMFTVGSAEPDAKLIELVSVIAGVLGKHPGFIVIRGHTDSRPYKNKKFDNWQLSTARAHMAHYMLVRGGLDEQRVRRVEGVADRDPKLPGRPEASENRRIDILLGQEP